MARPFHYKIWSILQYLMPGGWGTMGGDDEKDTEPLPVAAGPDWSFDRVRG